MERYFLVSECLYCLGKCYGCILRVNCIGKWWNCYVMCKVIVYVDVFDMVEVFFFGSYGIGNVIDLFLYRLLYEGKKRWLVDEESSDFG